MKRTLLLISILILLLPNVDAQSRKVLSAQIATLSAKIEAVNAEMNLLKEQNSNMKKEIAELKTRLSASEDEIDRIKQANEARKSGNNSPQPASQTSATDNESHQCKATTAAGNQCSRNADPGSDYCWQHKKKYESSGSSPSGSDGNEGYNGHTIQTGPRGGKYYINSKGKKVYIKR